MCIFQNVFMARPDFISKATPELSEPREGRPDAIHVGTAVFYSGRYLLNSKHQIIVR